jgi:hypothetical protein
MIGKSTFGTAIGLALISAPLAAHSVETAKGNWSDIPLLARHHTVRLNAQAMAGVDAAVVEGKCSIIGNGKRINLDMDFLVEFAPDNNIKRVIVEEIGCPEVEQIAATATSQAASKGWLKPTGENETGWYRGSITYQLR